MRKLAFGAAALGLVIVSLWGLWSLWESFTANRAAIAQAEAEAGRLTGERDSLIGVISERESRIAALGLQRDSSESLAASWRDSVALLEVDRAAMQFTIRQTSTLTELEAELRSTFPELGPSLRFAQGRLCPPGPPCSAWGLMTVSLAGDTLGLEYLAVPAWFAETFVIDHDNAESWRAQKDRLLAADSLQLLVTVLADSVARLEKTNAEAYQSGYQVAYASYQQLSSRYVAELKKPRISLGSTVRFVATAGLGILVGRATR